ncbi:MAG TPA: DUF2695 domain-containing protein [Terriglobales bacterium]
MYVVCSRRMKAAPGSKFIASIAPDVMKSLERAQFIAKLDDLFCPKDRSQQPKRCRGDFRHSKSILKASGYDSAALADILGVLRSQGGFCDCEVLYNVAKSSRLKSRYWKAKAKKLTPAAPKRLHMPAKRK